MCTTSMYVINNYTTIVKGWQRVINNLLGCLSTTCTFSKESLKKGKKGKLLFSKDKLVATSSFGDMKSPMAFTNHHHSSIYYIAFQRSFFKWDHEWCKTHAMVAWFLLLVKSILFASSFVFPEGIFCLLYIYQDKKKAFVRPCEVLSSKIDCVCAQH